ncbi:hypothetical protein [Paraburkholderia heleia]|uniref:hypothetical protein n=1 Tax=Paraburkholderia heleia TaxID=634127 RepID=UPI002AB65A2A|nr:hypothetical protein [Paraburkholderia heleia]
MPAAIAIDSYAKATPPARSADFEGPFAPDGTPERDLSVLLLDLYALANQIGIGEFENGFFRPLSSHLAFEAGWTGVTTHTATGPVMHNRFTWRLQTRIPVFCNLHIRIRRLTDVNGVASMHGSSTSCFDAHHVHRRSSVLYRGRLHATNVPCSHRHPLGAGRIAHRQRGRSKRK